MTKKSDNPRSKITTFKQTKSEFEQFRAIVKGSGCSTSEAIRRSLSYATMHPYQVLAAREDEAK